MLANIAGLSAEEFAEEFAETIRRDMAEMRTSLGHRSFASIACALKSVGTYRTRTRIIKYYIKPGACRVVVG